MAGNPDFASLNNLASHTDLFPGDDLEAVAYLLMYFWPQLKSLENEDSPLPLLWMNVWNEFDAAIEMDDELAKVDPHGDDEMAQTLKSRRHGPYSAGTRSKQFAMRDPF